MDILSNPITWAIIGALAAVIIIPVTILLYLIQRTIKRLAYEVVSDAPVFSIKEEVKDKIQVLFNGRRIDDAHLVILRVWNNGNAPIKREDYERPIKFDFGEKAEVLDAAVLETSPNTLIDETSIEIDERSVTLFPLLLNKGEMVTLKALLANYKENLKLKGHIVGIKQINKSVYNPEERYDKIINYISIAITILIISLLLIVLSYTIFTHTATGENLMIININGLWWRLLIFILFITLSFFMLYLFLYIL